MIVEEVKPIGYCLGVIQAINVSLKIRKDYPLRPIYVFGLLVHNDAVTKLLKEYNIETLDITSIDVYKRLKEFKDDDIVIFTAHGHPESYEDILKENNILYFDTTCSRVKKNISLIDENIGSRQIIYIGKSGHPETIAALSRGDSVLLYEKGKPFDYSLIKTKDPLVINQTTLSFLEINDIHEDIQLHVKDAIIVDEICNATRIRQEGLAKVNDDGSLVVIIGSNKSSNTKKLYEVATLKLKNNKVVMVDSLLELKEYNLKGFNKAYIASGTSTSLDSIGEIRKYLEDL